MTPLVESPSALADPSLAPRHEEIVAALRAPETHSDGTARVELIETHRAWVFLTDAHAYKLAKASAARRHDSVSLERRRLACQDELELNRRLGGDVYQGVVPLARLQHGYRVGWRGPAVEWLLAMRRLPRASMLDVAIAEGSVRAEQVDSLADTLLSFYARATPAPLAGPAYRQQLLRDIEAKRASLALPGRGLRAAPLTALAAELRAWVERRGALLEERAARIVDAHGDLRPEHVCIEPRPLVIDCLEFERALRLLDPISELSFLALECRRLGAAWIGARLLARLSGPLGSSEGELVRFYQGYHALVRAAVAIWHLDDPEQRAPERWRRRAEQYLELGLQAIGAAPEARSRERAG